MKHKNFSYAKYGYIFCIPFVVVFLVFSLYPLLYTVGIGFTDLRGASMMASEAKIQTKNIKEEIVKREVISYDDDGDEVITYVDIPGADADDVKTEEIPQYDDEGNPKIDRSGNEVVIINQTLNGEKVIIESKNKLDEFGEPIIKLDPFGNFKTVLNMSTFRNAFVTTFRLWIVNFIPQVLLAVVLATWFTSRWSKIKGQGLFKVLFYMPNIITAGTIAVLFRALFLYPTGVVNDTMINLGFFEVAKSFETDANAQRLIVSFIQFWMWYGYTMLLVISGILGLNPEMYESADIDGAGPVKQFFYITLPNLRTILLYVFITSLIGGLNMFDIPMLYANGGGPAGGTTTTSIFIFQQAFAGAYRYNTASAASVIMFLVIGVLSAGLFYIMRDKDAAKLKKMKKAEARALKAQQGGNR